LEEPRLDYSVAAANLQNRGISSCASEQRDSPVLLMVLPQSSVGQLLRHQAIAQNSVVLDLANAAPIEVASA